MESENIPDDPDRYYIYHEHDSLMPHGYGPAKPKSYYYDSYSDYNTSSDEYLDKESKVNTDAWPEPSFVKKPKEITICYCEIL